MVGCSRTILNPASPFDSVAWVEIIVKHHTEQSQFADVPLLAKRGDFLHWQRMSDGVQGRSFRQGEEHTFWSVARVA